jgi:Fe-S-cluster-containing dehydrogenase component/DMSO reductase anchor subunit
MSRENPCGIDPLGSPSGATLIDALLAEQQTLTAVERFSRSHDARALPEQARFYRDLIPLEKPREGEQYAFGVDLDACTGCKACVSACHSLNGLDDGETWRDIGLLLGGTVQEPWQQTVTTACHHCLEPGCLEGCPVRAYEKDAATGIVRHLDDQCIGCQYCVLKCPYDVPKYSAKRGIVRKCDMCYGRLSAGEPPACVQACPNGAISIRTVERAQLLSEIEPGDRLLPGAFDSSYTKPATVYSTSRSDRTDPTDETGRGIPANARPGNAGNLALEPAHWPLVWMLVLTQLAAGVLLGASGIGLLTRLAAPRALPSFAFVSFLALNAGLAVSLLHLGRPLGAWRAFLGLRTSWMSREILAFSLFAGAAAAFTGAVFWERIAQWLPALRAMEHWINPARFIPVLGAASAGCGVLGVFCSGMIYIDTRRAFWNGPRTLTRFFGTTLLLGSSAALVLLHWQGWAGQTVRPFAILALVVRLGLFAWEWVSLRRSLLDEADPAHACARVIAELLFPGAQACCCLVLGAVFFGLGAIFGTGGFAHACALIAFLLNFAEQVVERYFFFAASVAPRMPGVHVHSSLSHS